MCCINKFYFILWTYLLQHIDASRLLFPNQIAVETPPSSAYTNSESLTYCLIRPSRWMSYYDNITAAKTFQFLLYCSVSDHRTDLWWSLNFIIWTNVIWNVIKYAIFKMCMLTHSVTQDIHTKPGSGRVSDQRNNKQKYDYRNTSVCTRKG